MSTNVGIFTHHSKNLNKTEKTTLAIMNMNPELKKNLLYKGGPVLQLECLECGAGILLRMNIDHPPSQVRPLKG